MLLIKSVGTKAKRMVNLTSLTLKISNTLIGQTTKPKVQLLQTKDNNDDGEIVTFKQVRYTVKN